MPRPALPVIFERPLPTEHLGVSLARVVRCRDLQRDSAKEVFLHLLDALLSEGEEAGEAVEPTSL